MTKFTYAQNNFISGELSPKLEGRNDIQEYFNGVARMENFIPLREGGVMRRPATQFSRAITADGSALGAFYPFIVSRTEAYIVAISTTHASKGSIEIYRTGYGTWNPSVALVYTKASLSAAIGTEILNLDNYGFKYVQVNNVMVLTHSSGSMYPLVIKRTAANTFTISSYQTTVDGQFVVTGSASIGRVRGLVFPPLNKVDTTTMTVTTPAGVNIKCNVATVFKTGHASSHIRINNAGVESVYYLAGDDLAANNQFTNCSLLAGPDLTGVGALSEFAIHSWNDYDGWPRAVSLYQQRLVFAGTNTQPNTIWFSRTENLYLLLNYKLLQDAAADVSGIGYSGTATSTILDTDAFEVALSADLSNEIKWMSSDRVLQIGTAAGEFLLTTVEGILGPSNVNVTAQTFFGSSDVEAVRVQNSTIFICADGKSVREIGFSDEKGSNVSRLLTVLSDQILYHDVNVLLESVHLIGFIAMAWQASRSILWLLTGAYRLVGVSIEPSSNTLAWHKHTIGGLQSTGENSKVLGLCVVPDDLGKFDMLYLNIEREVNSATVQYMERMADTVESVLLYGNSNTDYRNSQHHSDSGYVPYTNTDADPLNWDVPHLEGETVEVMVEGYYYGTQVVAAAAGGFFPYISIDTAVAAGDIVVGLAYKGTLQSMVIEAGSKIGNAFIQLKQLHEIMLKIYRGKKYKVGTTADNLEEVDISVTNPGFLVTKSKLTTINSTPDEDKRFYIESNSRFPLTILSAIVKGTTQD